MVDEILIKRMEGNFKQARKLLKECKQIGISALERYIRMAAINLHCILWLNSEATQYRPDLPLED